MKQLLLPLHQELILYGILHNVLFIDEIHTLVGAGAAEGSIDAASMLKPALARGGVQCKADNFILPANNWVQFSVTSKSS